MIPELNPIAQHNLRHGAEPDPHLNLVDPVEAFCEVCGLHHDAGPLGFGTAGCPGCDPMLAARPEPADNPVAGRD